MKTSMRKFEDYKMDERQKLMGLWVTLMLLYIYCDIYSFHRTGYINEIIAGKIGPFDVSQAVLAVFSGLMIIPILMIPACLFLKARAVKWLNLVVAAMYTLVNIGNLVGETWVYYWVFGILEIAVTIGIALVAIRWNDNPATSA